MQSTRGLCNFPNGKRTFAFAEFVCAEGNDGKGAADSVGYWQNEQVGYISAEIERVSIYEERGS